MGSQSRLWERIRFFPYPFVLRYAKILVEPEVVLMSHRFFISILYSKGAKILAPFEYVICEDNQIGFQGRLWPCEGRRPESDLAGGAIGN